MGLRALLQLNETGVITYIYLGEALLAVLPTDRDLYDFELPKVSTE